jgi:glyoxylase-like metal-dependent hydrolase (beta-lactamase superfamily II)
MKMKNAFAVSGICAGIAASVAALIYAPGLLAQQQIDFDKVEMHVLPVQGNVSMLVGAGGNITVQAGKQGVLLVDTEYGPLAPKIMAEIRKLSQGPIRYIINTHVHGDHVGGNEALVKLIPTDPSQPLNIVAHENVLNRMTTPVTGNQTPPPQPGLPTSEYYLPEKDLYFNGEAVVLYHAPNAHTDGDSIVFFRKSDVISTGDLFTPERYPGIDLTRGGNVNGIISALNRIIQIAIPEDKQEGGTSIIPGHGRLCEEADVVEYRDMITIVRDRIQDLMRKGRTLEQIKAAKPTLDYDTRYGSGDAFIENVYKSLSQAK